MTPVKWLVSRWMAPQVVAVSPQDVLLVAFELMQEHGIRHVPVVSEGKLVGIVSDRDIRRHLPTRAEVQKGASVYSERLVATHVQDVMVPNPLCVSPHASLRDATALIFREKIGALPVAVEGRLVGIITAEDILWALQSNVDDLWAAVGLDPIG